MCGFPHVVVIGASSGAGRAITLRLAGLVVHADPDGDGRGPGLSVTGELAVIRAFVPLLRQARGRIVMAGSAGARLSAPFAGPQATVRETLRRELGPWHVDVVLTEPAAGAVARALTVPDCWPRASAQPSRRERTSATPASAAPGYTT